MQSVYAMQQSSNDDIIREDKFLKHSILKMFDLYVLNIQLLVEVQKLAAKRIALSKKKILVTKEELNPKESNWLLRTTSSRTGKFVGKD
jgi:N utilization substance protein B